MTDERDRNRQGMGGTNMTRERQGFCMGEYRDFGSEGVVL